MEGCPPPKPPGQGDPPWTPGAGRRPTSAFGKITKSNERMTSFTGVTQQVLTSDHMMQQFQQIFSFDLLFGLNQFVSSIIMVCGWF